VWDPARLPITAFLALTAIQEQHATRRSRFLQLVAFRFAVENLIKKICHARDGDATRYDENQITHLVTPEWSDMHGITASNAERKN